MWPILRTWFLDARIRYALSWGVLLTVLAARLTTACTNFENDARPDGNDGHTAIDFGGQWLMGRLLVTGHGRELYSRPTHLAVAREAYPIAREAPGQSKHDADLLVGCFPGRTDNPLGGPLYPPIHAFVMAPVGCIDNPQVAYRVVQVLMFIIVGLTGWGIRVLSQGRWWWPLATAVVLLAPGCRAGLDLGQNNTLTLALLVWGWALRVRGRAGWAGVVWGLLAFKPVWALSFWAALVLLRQWRMTATMSLTGLAAIVVTIPVVGMQAWFDWLNVGQMATAVYCVDHNWIFLSRDVFGIPRRIWLDFADGKAINDRPLVGYLGWVLWFSVVLPTVWLVWRCRLNRMTGPLPAMVFAAAWLGTYRFMYYDSVVAQLAVVVLLANPRSACAKGQRWTWCFVLLLFVIENVTVPMHIDISASIQSLKETITHADGTTTTTAPTIYLSTADEYPWDTVAVWLLWLRCGWLVWRERLNPS